MRAQARVPLQGTIEPTFRCNLRCVHCYVNEPVSAPELSADELPLDRLLELVDEIAASGTLTLLLTGGEVLVRPDFPELYRYAHAKGLLITIFTNGTMITDRIADLFVEHRPEWIEISLYGMTRETYERVTQVEGSYDKCLAGIRRLLDRDLPLKLKTMALRYNVHEMAAMQAYADELGLGFRFDTHLNARVDCGANRNGELQLSAREAIALDLQHGPGMQELRDFCRQFVPERAREREQVYSCGAGEASFTVDPYGQLQMCQLSRKSSFDLKTGSFREGWDEFFPKLRARRWRSNSVCRSCNLISLCASCPGAAEIETGDLEGIVPQFCEIAHERAFEAMPEVLGHMRDASCCLKDAERRAGALREVDSQGSGCDAHAEPQGQPLIQLQRRRSTGL